MDGIKKSKSDIGVPNGCDSRAGKILTSKEAGKDSIARMSSPAKIHTFALILLAAKTKANVKSKFAIISTITSPGPKYPQRD